MRCWDTVGWTNKTVRVYPVDIVTLMMMFWQIYREMFCFPEETDNRRIPVNTD